MEEALKEAYKAYEKKETPIRSCYSKRWRKVTIARAHNQTEELNDSTAHAEILAIRKAAKKLGGWRLIDCDLYVTMEPCIMCSGAIVNSRIKKLIIGTKHIKNAYTKKQHEFKLDYYETSNVEVYFGVLKDECSNILQEFFKTLREREYGEMVESVEGARLESEYTSKAYRGFESHSLRQRNF